MQAMAKAHIGGRSFSELATYTGLTHAKVRQLFKQQAMKDIMAKEQGYLAFLADQANTKLHMNVEDAVDKQIGLMGSKSDEMVYKASKFVIDKVLPDTHIVKGEHNHYHSAEIEVLAGIGTAIQGFRQIPPTTNGQESFEPYLLKGTEGIELPEPSDTAHDIGAEGPVGSGPTQESEPDGGPEPPHDQ